LDRTFTTDCPLPSPRLPVCGGASGSRFLKDRRKRKAGRDQSCAALLSIRSHPCLEADEESVCQTARGRDMATQSATRCARSAVVKPKAAGWQRITNALLCLSVSPRAAFSEQHVALVRASEAQARIRSKSSLSIRSWLRYAWAALKLAGEPKGSPRSPSSHHFELCSPRGFGSRT
jgi:hypothetical protein